VNDWPNITPITTQVKMTRQAIYDRLRAIGVSVESADAVSEALEPLPDKKVEAFLLYTMGYTWDEISNIIKISKRDINMVLKVSKNVLR
jgi:DNA-directed RNA polymerase specialized sigma24 family protein